MQKTGLLLCAFLAFSAQSDLACAQQACQLCASEDQAAKEQVAKTPLKIDVEAGLNFSNVALISGDGTVAIDPRSGGKQVSGGLKDLGGFALRGTVHLSGQPMAPVRIDLPNRITLRSSTGANVQVVDIETDLSPSPQLGPDGQLSFNFGGRLLTKSTVFGAFRGNIPITAEYQ